MPVVELGKSLGVVTQGAAAEAKVLAALHPLQVAEAAVPQPRLKVTEQHRVVWPWWPPDTAEVLRGMQPVKIARSNLARGECGE